MSDIAIKVEHLSKRYRIGLREELPDTLVGAVTQAVRRPLRNWRRLRRLTTFRDDGRPTADDDSSSTVPSPKGRPSSAGVRTDVDRDTIWALKDVSFEVERGEVVGIIGRNGAGKSTLLKILSQITAPTEGRAVINGRVGSLLEVGTGFHPELTGRENIYLNGTILGMTRAEIGRKFDEIVDFSGVEKFIDTPVKRYSSGMRVRLAFSVAAHLDPEILLVDEVLAVGDAAFQKKCLGKMEDVTEEGRTVLFVSHNMAMINSLCREAILLEHGCLRTRDSTANVVETYLGDASERSGEYVWAWSEDQLADLGPFIPISLRVLNHEGEVSDRVLASHGCEIEFRYRLAESMSNLRVGFSLQTSDGQWAFVSFDRDRPEDHGWYRRMAGEYVARCAIPRDLLNDKTFVLGVITGIKGAQVLYVDKELIRFSVRICDGVGSHWGGNRAGVVRPALQWETQLVA